MRISISIGLFLPPFWGLDVCRYASRPQERRFLPKSAEPLKRSALNFAFGTARFLLIVVALIGDEATVKTFYKEDGHYRLQPENKTMEPIIAESVVILGKVVASLRLY
mgnify:CR=1 FL=1